MNILLRPILALTYGRLSAFANTENFWYLFDTAFGLEYNRTIAKTWRSQWQTGDFSQLPEVELLDSSLLGNSQGSYSTSTNKIYLSTSFVTTAKPAVVSAALLEQIGLFVNAQINQSNQTGDKKATFAELVQGNNSIELEVQSIQPTVSQILGAGFPTVSHSSGCTCSSCALPPVDRQLSQPQSTKAISIQPVAAASSPTVAAALPTLDLSKTFFLNSLPGANHTIYLDFDGHTTFGTYWNSSISNIVTPRFDIDGDITSFSTDELERIQYIWQRVAEDFSPFNVNVTTQAPADINDLIKSGTTTDTRWGIRVVIGGSSKDWYGPSAGGIAYVGSFNWDSDTPTFVFSDTLYDDEKYTSDAITHEVGHTLGLYHDGLTSGVEYYSGHGGGDTGWASIMGVAYYQNLTQWSKGEYGSANNTQDDLQIITTQNGFGYREDDAGNTIAAAKALGISGTSVNGSGIIERNTDIDFYHFVTDAGAINLTVNPLTSGANLDILAELYNSAGTLIASSNPTDLLSATIATTVANGTYYLKIDGVGKGDPLSTGYTDYGSLGQYFISGNIVASNPNITLAVSPSSVNEDGTANLIYTFTRTGSTTNALTINYNVAGTATFSTDYTQSGATSFTSTTGTITFGVGATTATLTINPTADTTIENNETVALTLASGTGYTVGTTTAVTGTITNDDLPIITLAVSPSSVNEDGTANLIYTFTRTGSTTNALTINYNVAGTATFSTDYTQSGATSFTSTTGTITFGVGATTATLTIDPTADTTIENNETVALTLASGTGYTVGTTTAVTGTITNDDLPIITLAVSPSSVNEDGTANLIYTFTRTGSTTNALTINYNVAGTATFSTDYTQSGATSFTSTTGTITFGVGATTATLTIDPTADTTIENNETVALTLASGTGYTVGTTTAVTGTITNDDFPIISISPNQTVVEGNTSPQNVTYTVNLSSASIQPITVQYATTDVSAKAGSDYTAITGTLTFNPGVTSQVINIPILNDSINEVNETFNLSLTSPTNANLGTTTTVTTTITDTLTASITTTLPTNVENLTLTGTDAIDGTGNAGNNNLRGNSANNTLSGNAGNDTYVFLANTPLGTDTIVEATSSGTDTLNFSGTTASVNVNLGVTTSQTVNSNLKLILSANNVIENVTGGTGDDRLTGNTLNNVLNGGDGNDQLQGLGGNDTLWGGLGNDILNGGTGNDQYLFRNSGVFSAALGVDYITQFDLGQDLIVLSKATFNAITNSAGQSLTDFAMVSDDELVDASNAHIVYSQSTGSLFYNQNGSVLGATAVFEFAYLGNPDITLSSANFSLIA